MTPDEERKIKTAYRNVFAHPEAGIVLADLAAVAENWKPSFRNSNPEGTAYGEGKRSLYLRIQQFSGVEDELKALIERRGRNGT